MGVIKKGLVKEIGIIRLDNRQKAEEVYIEPLEPEDTDTTDEVNNDEPQISKKEIEEKSEHIFAGAKQKADQIIAEAKKNADEIRNTAREQGYNEGLESGKSESQQNVSENIHESLKIINQAIEQRRKIVKDSENEILRLALKVAEQIVKNEITLHRDVCLNIVSDAISRVSDRESIIVKVNREDLESLKRYRDRIASIVDGVKNFSIIEDASVEPGGCIIETNLGFVDAQIKTKLAAIEEAFQKANETESN